MGDTFGGMWNRPGPDRDRGRSMREVQDSASFDNEPQTSCLGCLLIATVLLAALAAAIGLAVT